MKKALKELIENAEETIKGAYEKGYSDGLAARDAEIVRCKECKHWERDVIFQDGWCRGRHQPNPNWFCADGERRDDGEIH